jgi:glycosyltransferase involved in cell wall biosynthesis
MNKIKSLHIDTEKTWRGGEQQVLYLVRVLKAKGETPTVICQKDSELKKKLHKEGILYHELKMRGELDIFSAFKIAKIVNNEGISILHAHTSHAHSLAVLASLFFKEKVPVVVSRRVDFKPKDSFINFIKYRIPDRYISVSKAIKDVLVSSGIPEAKVSVVHSGVDINKFPDATKEPLIKEFGLSPDDRIIGNIAHLADHKGQKYLVSAFKLLLNEIDNVKLFIVGKGELERELKRQVKELGLEESVIFTGFRDDVGNLLKLFNVFVMSSHLEGLGTSILDAFVMRTPVVATDAGGIPEMIKDKVNGRLVRSKDPEALKEGIKFVLKNPDAAKEYSDNGYRSALTNFDYKVTAEKTLQVYREILSL